MVSKLVPLRLITSTITLIDEALTLIEFPVDHIAWALERNASPIM